nr:extracellular solute-binding protein [uncultured Acetatifactor sp.]
MRKRKKAYLAAVFIIVLAAVFFRFFRTDERKEAAYDFPAESFLASDIESGTEEINVDIFQYRSEGADIAETEINGTPALAWKNAGGTLEFPVNAPEHAKYHVIVTYSLLEDSYGAIERALTVNGETQYSELSNILFSNNFMNMTYPFEQDEYGNEIIPRQEKVIGLYEQLLWDRNAMYFEPLEIELKKGDNLLCFQALKGTMAIAAVKLVPVAEIPDYADYNANQRPNNANDYYCEIEAENIQLKSGKNIQYIASNEPGISPEGIGKKTLNTIGGENYSNAHDFIEWSVSVPEDGYYNLAFKYRQNYNSSLTSFRRLTVDGERLFRELEYIPFVYERKWGLAVLGGDTPYQIYLAEGEHRIRLEVTNAPYREISNLLHSVSSGMAELDLEVKEIVGVSQDVYRLWNLESYIPDLTDRLKENQEKLNQVFDRLEALTGRGRTDFNTLSAAYQDLEKTIEDISLITSNVDTLSNIYTAVSEWETTVTSPSLLLDTVCIKSIDSEFPEIETGTLERARFAAVGFLKSFAASSMQGTRGNEDTEVVQVWVQRNRDYVDLMQQMANEYYTKETGVRVEVNYCPVGMNLLVLANASDKKPDIVTGVDIGIPFEFAVRDALVDLSKYPEFEELIADVVPGSRIPYQIGDREYAIAEEVKTNILYYRKDILGQLGVEIPETWEETTKAASTLLQNNYNFFYPYGDFLTFFFQRDVDVYTENGMDIAFDNVKGYEAFKYWTDLYLKYGIDPKMSSFYQHFRLGDVPLGITGIDQYMLLDMAAPDITGKWSVAVSPGIINEEGENIRWQAGTQNGAMIFKSNEAREDRAWDFLKWWLSDEVQFMYADDLENIYGEEFRYFSANTEVVAKQNWNEDVKEAILEQLSWYRQIPMVPGGSYITQREIWNAWTRTVIDKKNYREQLDEAIELIRPEMRSKQEELGYIDEDGNLLK